MNEQTALLLARTILSDSFVISAELRALETTILPDSFANAFLARLLFSHDELVDYSSNEYFGHRKCIFGTIESQQTAIYCVLYN